MNTGMPKTDRLSRERLAQGHPDLRRLVDCAMTFEFCPKFSILEVMRTRERQVIMVKSGASTTMDSRHRTGHAFDAAVWLDFDADGDLDLRWDFGLYVQLAKVMKLASGKLDIPIVWGGDWKTLRDGPHFELSRKRYPMPEQT